MTQEHSIAGIPVIAQFGKAHWIEGAVHVPDACATYQIVFSVSAPGKKPSNSHFKRSASETTVEAVETMSALSGIGWFDVEGLEHESEQMIPVIERKVLDQSTQVLKECTPRWK
jgi:hypothetical protein